MSENVVVSDPMKSLHKVAIAFWMAALNVALTWGLVQFGPGNNPFWGPINIETRFLLITVSAGALGSCIHLATSFVNTAGGGKLMAGWVWWYALRPGIGAALALVVYFVIRAGLIAGAGDAATASMNPHGVAAVASLSGMFAKQATEKLKEVSEQVLATHKDPPAA